MSIFVNQAAQSDNLVEMALRWLRSGRRIALITLVNIEGSAPYPVGTQMLVADDGEFRGQISGGCVEKSIADQARLVIAEGQSQTHRYGLGSPFFDIQLPCGSGIDVFIDVNYSIDELQSIQTQLDKRQTVTQLRMTDAGEIQKVYLPTPRLIIAGQSAILNYLARSAQLSGFETLCFAAQNVMGQSEVMLNPLPQLPRQETEFKALCDSSTALVSLFHEHQLEIDILKTVLDTELFYIGALGSRLTQKNRLQELSKLQIEKGDLDRIHGPVGLDINASTPQQIAISILADIIRLMPRKCL